VSGAAPAAAACGFSAAGVGTAAVLGLGLIGGSLARDLAAGGVRVLGHDRHGETLAAATAEGVVHHALDASLHGIGEADLALVAVPVQAAPELLARLAALLPDGALVMDVGSTKRAVVEAAQQAGLGARFVGAHPLAGDHRSGWGTSRRGLFREARVFLAPAPDAAPACVQRARSVWAALGARPELLPAAEHDRRLAWSSHLPQAAATALALALSDARVSREELGPGGRDATRLAASDAEMWVGIARDNAENLAGAITGLEERLRTLRRAVEHGNVATLHAIFREAARWAGS
jgi:prephenate dehydrogenase